jgi:hypothetical protein
MQPDRRRAHHPPSVTEPVTRVGRIHAITATLMDLGRKICTLSEEAIFR